MITITKDVIIKCGKNLMFDISEAQVDLIYDEFNTVLAQIDFLKSIKGVDEYEPMTFPYKEHQTILREDKPCKPLDYQESLKNSKTKLGNQIKLPRVVGNNKDEISK